MGLHLQFRRYRLPLRTTVRTAHEVWTEREGVLLRLADDQGHLGWGEAAPIPAFGTETVPQVDAVLRSLGEWPTIEQLDAVPKSLACLRSALTSARLEMAGDALRSGSHDARGASAPMPLPVAPSTDSRPYLAVAALLPAGRAALPKLTVHAEAGFRTFKWKVGVGDLADELALLDDVCAALPSGARLRLDANGAWDRRQAERWLERCADRPIEFVEQPCFSPKGAGELAWRRSEDLLRGLAQDFPTPIALDESVVADTDVSRWLEQGWSGWYVVKPSLLGDMAGVCAQLARARATVVFSSALETAVGARAALRFAFAWSGEPKAIGFGVWPLFADPRFDGPAAAPFVRREDVDRISPESLWSALN